MKMKTVFLMTLVITFFAGIDVLPAGTIDSFPSTGSFDAAGALAQGGTFPADDNYLAQFTIQVCSAIALTFRPFILGTMGDGTPTTGPVLWESPDVYIPPGCHQPTFYPNLPLTVGNLYFIGLDYGHFTCANDMLIPFGSNSDNPIPEGRAWRFFSTGWNPFYSGVDLAVHIEMTADCVATAEVCTGGTDEDCDGLIDAADPDCPCLENETCFCGNGIDDDCDGLIDGDDPDCTTTSCAGSAASTVSVNPVYSASDLGRQLAYFMLPLGAMFGLMIWRRKR